MTRKRYSDEDQLKLLLEIKLGRDVKGIKDVYAEVLGNFDCGSADAFADCPVGLSSDIGPRSGKSGSGSFGAHAIVG